MNDCSCPSRGETPHSIDCPADVWHMMPPESLRERLAADGLLWKQAYAEGVARGRAERDEETGVVVAALVARAEVAEAVARRAEALADKWLEHAKRTAEADGLSARAWADASWVLRALVAEVTR